MSQTPNSTSTDRCPTVRTIAYDSEIFARQPYGGISRYFCEIATRLADFSFRPMVVAPLHFNHHLLESSVPHCGAYMPRPTGRGARLYQGVNQIVGPIALRLMRPALIHRTYYSSRRIGSVPSVVTVLDMIHELFAQEFAPSDPTSEFKRRCVRDAQGVICISHSTARDLTRLFGVPPEKIAVTHLGPARSFSAGPRDRETSPHQRPYLLYVGERRGYKNFERFLRAYARSNQLRSVFDVVLFGGARWSSGERALCRELGISSNRLVHLTGSDEMLARAYRHAHIFVYPSMYEGFGIPPLEAMASGCVVACSNTSSLPEVVGDAAVQFDPSDVAAISEAIEKASFDETVRAALRSTGFGQAARFGWDRCAAETAAVYRSLVDLDTRWRV